MRVRIARLRQWTDQAKLNTASELSRRECATPRIAAVGEVDQRLQQPARTSGTAPRSIKENRAAERPQLRALRMISHQLTVAIFRLLLGNAHANALRKCRKIALKSTPAHPGDCNNPLEGRLVLGRDPLVPFEPAASTTLISTASACLRTSIFGRL